MKFIAELKAPENKLIQLVLYSLQFEGTRRQSNVSTNIEVNLNKQQLKHNKLF